MDVDALARLLADELQATLNADVQTRYCDCCDVELSIGRPGVVGWWELEAYEREAYLSAARAVLQHLEKTKPPLSRLEHELGGEG